ncbi:hypothetical protein [Aurantibacillus circumpalustris]|uniref:hypothetical protein n=1 Tax=Aurantibacillus circumpalustris TaxID=3036359 RepID=UPI00295BFA92|nr:hypothetical protein [Aurantibacillus circumpalustris]
MILGQDTLKRTHDTLLFKGQFSTWINFNPSNNLPVWLGGRYIPQANYKVKFPNGKLLDFEASLNMSGQAGFHLFDTVNVEGNIRPYRLWGRYSGKQFEIRIGLQKINFGSASMLRPLMWFDQIDPRDPLQITNGVYGVLVRYYYKNNANLWLWGLYRNDKPKTWEVSGTSKIYPEFGGRFQAPTKKGEVAVSYHSRMADMRDMGYPLTEVPENRVGVDGKWDLGIGLWYEAAWIHKHRSVGVFSNQEIMTLGADYTFDIGSGLNTTFEQFLVSYDEYAFSFSNANTLSALSLSLPVGMFHNVSAIVYYDWVNNNAYNFLNWKRQFKHFYLYIMAYWNPENSVLPQQQNTSTNLLAGKGIQIMLVFNH